MTIRDFLLWSRAAPADHRAEAAAALARSYLGPEMTEADRQEAELALLALLDDPEPAVRRALAEVLAPARETPAALLAGLLQDRSTIAALVLEQAPELGEADLIDHAAVADEAGQQAIARRRTVPAAVAGALAEVACEAAVAALLDNPGAVIARVSLARIVERFGSRAAVRQRLLGRSDLPVEMRLALASALARSIRDRGGSAGDPDGRIAQAAREAHERAILTIARDAPASVARRTVAHLRRSSELTAALVLRASVAGDRAFVEDALCELTGLPPVRVSALLEQGGTAAEALLRRAGLPAVARPALLAVLEGLRDRRDEGPAERTRRLIELALTASAGSDAAPVAALLRRYDSEAAREAARALVRSVEREAALLELTEADLRPEPSPDRGGEAASEAA
jgi:uncharacterized protein (DUF2336 family)